MPLLSTATSVDITSKMISMFVRTNWNRAAEVFLQAQHDQKQWHTALFLLTDLYEMLCFVTVLHLFQATRNSNGAAKEMELFVRVGGFSVTVVTHSTYDLSGITQRVLGNKV